MSTIAFVGETAKVGGAEINLLRLLPRLQQAGWNTLVLVPEEGLLLHELTSSGISWRVVRGGPFYSISSYMGGRRKVPNPLAWAGTFANGQRWMTALHQALREIRPDIVQTVSMLSHLFGGWATNKLGLPGISQVQDIVASNSSLGIYNTVFQSWALHVPSRIACVSPLVASQFDANPLARRKARVIMNMVDLDRFQPDVSTSEALNDSKLRIGTVARLTRWKGLHIALQAARSLKAKGASFEWRFLGDASLGDGGYAQELLAQVQRLRLQKEVTFVPWREDMPPFYQSRDIIVHLPTEPDPAPLVISEALACGLPVVASHTGLDDCVREAGGLLVPAGDVESAANAILGLADQLPEHHTEFQHCARAAAEKYFSPDAIIPQWLELYEDARTVYSGARI